MSGASSRHITKLKQSMLLRCLWRQLKKTVLLPPPSDRQRVVQLSHLLLGRRQIQDDDFEIFRPVGMLPDPSDVIAHHHRLWSCQWSQQPLANDCHGQTGTNLTSLILI